MEFAIVSALSLTYSRQQRFTETSQSSLPPVLRINQCLAPSVREQIDLARSYLTSLTRDEVELQTVYRQALEIIGGRTEEAAGNP